jgi:hypothetical protein
METQGEGKPSRNQRKPASKVMEARYSLRELMAEVDVERRDSAFAHELVDNEEIRKMFRDVRAAKRRLRNG